MEMEAYEQQLKEQADLIRRLSDDLNKLKKGDKEKESDGGGIWVDLGSASGKKKRKRNDDDGEDDDAGEAAIKQVFKKAKLNEFDGIKNTGEDLEAWIEELEDFFALLDFSEEAKAKKNSKSRT